MNSKELRLLGEAYAKISESQTEEVVEETVAEEQLDEMDIVGKLRRGLEKIGVKGTSPTLDKERSAQTETERKSRYANIKATGDGSYASGALNNSADLFDIVKGHLMSEGYADTEEAALAIMANMSEEWRTEIVEGSCMGGGKKKKKKKSGY